MDNYKFTTKWFLNTAKSNWDILFAGFKPKRVLEIGSYEGMATCYMILNLGQHIEEIHCIDTWEGGFEHQALSTDMSEVEERFRYNIQQAIKETGSKLEVIKYRQTSFNALVEMNPNFKYYFDFIYIDGSHLPEDVLADAVLAFPLLKVGGLMIFDDYLYATDELSSNYSPKLAIDAFTTVYFDLIQIVPTLSTQMAFVKKAEKRTVTKEHLMSVKDIHQSRGPYD